VAQFFQVIWREHRKQPIPPELNNYPATPSGYYEGYFPGSTLATSNRTEFKSRLQRLPELNTFPAAAVVSPLTAYLQPAANRIRFKIKRGAIPELNSYPAAIVGAPVTSWLTHFEHTQNATNRKPLFIELNTYPATPAGYYTGYYPGSALAESYGVKYKAKRQAVPEHNIYPVAASIADITAWLTHFEVIRNVTNRRRLDVTHGFTIDEIVLAGPGTATLTDVGPSITLGNTGTSATLTDTGASIALETLP
jgi:hypothetical protein